jgi:2-dehydropantoate 2-reductase
MGYVVLGAGAIGGLIGGLLQQSGSAVRFVARGAHLEAMRARGLTLATPDGTRQLAVHSSDRLGDLAGDDVVLLCTKSQDSAGALRNAFPTTVICMQNGVGNERLVAERGARTYGAMVFAPASHLAPGHVSSHSAPCPGVIDIGCHPSGVDALCTSVVADLQRAGFDARTEPDITRLKYTKLLANLGNVLQALGGADALRHPICQQVADEARAVLDAAAIAYLDGAALQARCGAIVDLPVEGEQRRGGSSWQSLARGSGSIETEHLNGEIVRIAALVGRSAPLNAGLCALAAQAVASALPAGSMPVASIASALAR